MIERESFAAEAWSKILEQEVHRPSLAVSFLGGQPPRPRPPLLRRMFRGLFLKDRFALVYRALTRNHFDVWDMLYGPGHDN